MSLLRSIPGGLRLAGWRPLVAVTLGFCLFPALAGGVWWLKLSVFGPEDPDLLMLATLIVLSPLITGPVWAVIGAGAAWAMRHGIYGSLTALLFGAVIGYLAGLSTGITLLMPLTAISATLHRFTLALIRPDAF